MARLIDHRWEWTLFGGVKIAATLDADERLESVFVADRLVSQAPRGAKPAGHALEEPSGVVVRFQPGALICILRHDGEEVSPNQWPVRKRAPRPTPVVFTLPLRRIALGVVVLAAALAASWAWTNRGALEGASRTPGIATFRAENGRFVAHHPARFSAHKPPLPAGMSGVVLVDPARAESIVLVAQTEGEIPNDPWLVQKKLHAEALASLPRDGSAHEEVSRTDDTCIHQAGAVVSGKSKTVRGEPATTWSCGFSNDGAAYLVMYSLPAAASSEDARQLREIVEATELTRLAAIQTQ